MFYHIFIASDTKGQPAKFLVKLNSDVPFATGNLIALDEVYGRDGVVVKRYFQVVNVEHHLETQPQSDSAYKTAPISYNVYVTERK